MQLKKIFSFFIFFFTTGFVFSEIPKQIKGIWTGKDRIIFFGGNDEISIILKEYYGWYYDRAVEPDDFSNIQERKRNAATQKLAHDYKVSFEKIANTTNAWEMTIFIDEKTKSVIPVALIDDKIYLDFLVKADSENQEEVETPEKNLLPRQAPAHYRLRYLHPESRFRQTARLFRGTIESESPQSSVRRPSP